MLALSMHCAASSIRTVENLKREREREREERERERERERVKGKKGQCRRGECAKERETGIERDRD
jgi:hypothetical protein